jgi:hypothetical protein
MALKEQLRDALEDMVYQFGYRGIIKGKPTIHSGGLSALEIAFEALGWNDPYILPEENNTCEVEGCMCEISSGQNWGDMYLRLCREHSRDCFKNETRPPIKEYAKKREAMRDKKTGRLNAILSE